MGLPYLFSPCVPAILGVFSYLREKCSKPKQPVKNSYSIAKIINLTKTLSRLFVCAIYFQFTDLKLPNLEKKKLTNGQF